MTEMSAADGEFLFVASEGSFGPAQISHLARAVPGSDSRFVTKCGKEFGGPGNMHPEWDTWGVGGPFGDDELPPINCPRCKSSGRPLSPAEWRIIERFEVSEPAPESMPLCAHCAGDGAWQELIDPPDTSSGLVWVVCTACGGTGRC